MKLTDKQRKALWIIAPVLLIIHFAPDFIAAVKRASQPTAPIHAKPSAAIAAPVQPLLPPPPAIDPQFARLSGIWAGKLVKPGAVTCALRLELRPGQPQPAEFTGYTSLSCGPSFLAMPGGPASVKQFNAVLNQMTPISTIATGGVVGGSIELHLDQTIGKADGCHPTAFTLTPFGDNSLAVKWQEDSPCEGGQMLMQRSPR
jgi:hypothetical protein